MKTFNYNCNELLSIDMQLHSNEWKTCSCKQQTDASLIPAEVQASCKVQSKLSSSINFYSM